MRKVIYLQISKYFEQTEELLLSATEYTRRWSRQADKNAYS